jgi:hypothetical protein
MLKRIPIKKFIIDKEAAQIFGLERATIAYRQGASEDQNFVAKPTQSAMNFFVGIGISRLQE